jgi:glycerol-3-phosphate O-acyltransferase/dihydroxyacetone phosphate acyltransferase
MLYFLIRPLAAIALKVYLRKISLIHAERIPLDKPVILASNHPTAFMEPCILACGLSRPLYFLVRGDMFAKPFYKRLLMALHMLPVYRLKDRGYAFVKANYETFDTCYEALRDKLAIMILAEGTTISEKRLRPLKKGTARVAFGALDKFPDIEDVYIVPVGVNFDHIGTFRAEVTVQFGDPISAREYYPLYHRNNNEGIDALTTSLSRQMAGQIVVIDNKSDEPLTEQLLALSRVAHPTDAKTSLQEEIRVTDLVNSMPEAEKTELAEKTTQFNRLLAKAGCSERSVFEDKKVDIFSMLLLVAGLLPAAAGLVLNILPGVLSRWIAEKRVESKEFYGSVLLTLSLFFYLIYYGVGALWVHRVFPFHWLWIIPLIAFLGYWGLIFKELMLLMSHRWNWGRLSASERGHLIKLFEEITEVFKKK